MTTSLTENPRWRRLVSRGCSGSVWEQVVPLRFTRGRVAFFLRYRKEWVVEGGTYIHVREHGIVLFGRCFSTSKEVTVFP